MINELSFFEDYEVIENIRDQLESLRDQGQLSEVENIKLPRLVEGGLGLSDAVEYEEESSGELSMVYISVKHFLEMSDREVMEYIRDNTLTLQ